MIKDLTDSIDVLRLFRVDRTGLKDLLPALRAMDERLAKYETAKEGHWRYQSVDTHLVHAIGHLSRALQEHDDLQVLIKELSACMLRVGFALTCLLGRVHSKVSRRRDSTEVW